MKWFKHSSSLRNDPKVKRLIRKYGADGYTIYVCIVEMIADSLEPTGKIIPYLEEEIMDLALEFNIDSGKVKEILRFCREQNLLQENTAGVIFCFKLYYYVDEYFTKNAKNREKFIVRNKAIISSYKEGGLESMLLCINNLVPNAQSIIGQIKIDSPYLLQSSSRVAPDKLPLEEKRGEEIREDNNIKKINKKEKPQAHHYTGEPEKPKSKNIFTEITEYWNEKVPEQATPFTSLNMSLSSDIIVILEQTDIQIIKTAIDHYGQAYEHNKYRVAGFTNFMTMKNIEAWYPESSVENRNSDKKSKDDELTPEQLKTIEELTF